MDGVASSSTRDKARYTVHTSENLGSKSVYVKDSSGRVLWHKTKELIGNEIVDSLTDVNGNVCWTIHKPTRGWYLVIRSPYLPSPSSFIGLRPSSILGQPDRFTFYVPPSFSSLPSALHHTSTSPSTSTPNGVSKTTGTAPVRTRVVDDGAEIKRRSLSSLKSPRPISDAGHDEGDDIMRGQSRPHEPHSATSHDDEGHTFVLSPCSTSITAATSTKTWSKFKSLFVDSSTSFSCTTLSSRAHSSAPTHPAPPPPPPPSASPHHRLNPSLLSSDEMFRFVDSGSLFSLSRTGTLCIRTLPHTMSLGSDVTFWIAVGLAYMDFLDDKEAYLAATEDVQY